MTTSETDIKETTKIINRRIFVLGGAMIAFSTALAYRMHFLQVKEQYRVGSLSEDGKCNLSFALAKMYEDIGDLNQAFNHLYKGNALRSKLLNYSIKTDKSLFNSLKKNKWDNYISEKNHLIFNSKLRPAFSFSLFKSLSPIPDEGVITP